MQVVDGMVEKGVLGYAESVIRKALQQQKQSQEFNWGFYQSIARLKQLSLVKKNSMDEKQYQIVPQLIEK